MIFPPLKCTSMNRLWYVIAVGEVMSQIDREDISLTTIKNKIGRETYLLREKEAYILATE